MLSSLRPDLATDGAKYPRWVDRRSATNLREVAPGLFVGAIDSPVQRVLGSIPFVAIVNFSQMPIEPLSMRAIGYEATPYVEHHGFDDLRRFPDGVLDRTLAVVRSGLRYGPVLLHCAAGKSRSVSAAYAMLRRIWKLDHATALRMARDGDPNFPGRKTLASARRWVHTGRS